MVLGTMKFYEFCNSSHNVKYSSIRARRAVPLLHLSLCCFSTASRDAGDNYVGELSAV